MRILEFGNKNNNAIILIHGLNIPWQMWNKEIEYFEKNYYVIVPVLDGHDTESNEPFISIEDEADKIKEYYTKNFGQQVYMVIGMSMGAAIALSLLSDETIQTKYLVLESGIFVSSSRLITSINKKLILQSKNSAKSKNAKALSQLKAVYGEQLTPYYIEMATCVSDKNLITAANAVGSFKLTREIKLKKTKIIAFHGTVFMEIMAKRSAKYLKKLFPYAYIKSFSRYNHGELSVSRPMEFIDEINKAIKATN